MESPVVPFEGHKLLFLEINGRGRRNAYVLSVDGKHAMGEEGITALVGSAAKPVRLFRRSDAAWYIGRDAMSAGVFAAIAAALPDGCAMPRDDLRVSFAPFKPPRCDDAVSGIAFVTITWCDIIDDGICFMSLQVNSLFRTHEHPWRFPRARTLLWLDVEKRVAVAETPRWRAQCRRSAW